jgi:hypothetical protein
LPLLAAYHYRGATVADPMHVFAWKADAQGPLLAAAFFAAPVNFYFGKGAVELVRLVRVPELTAPLSQFVAETLRWLKRHTPTLYVLSYADSGQGHHGGIYRALGFTHVRVSKGHSNWRHPPTGAVCSSRAFDQRSPENKVGWVRAKGTDKYLYVKPIHEPWESLAARFGWSALPYPKPDPSKVGVFK